MVRHRRRKMSFSSRSEAISPVSSLVDILIKDSKDRIGRVFEESGREKGIRAAFQDFHKFSGTSFEETASYDE